MRALLGSGGIGTDERRELYRDLMSENFADCERVVFVPFASNDYDGYTKRMQEFAGQSGYELIGLHEFDDPLAAIEAMDGVYVGGGIHGCLCEPYTKEDSLNQLGRQYCKEVSLTLELVQVQM